MSAGQFGAGRKAVVLLSGGLDSMVCAGLAREAGFAIQALTIDYNQRHRREIDAAKVIAAEVGAERHVILPLDLRQFGGSALTADLDVPKDGVGPDIPVTYVPARNLVFLSLTLAWAEALGARDIFIGVNALDYSGYPDCRPEFIAGFADLARLATKAGAEGGDFQIHAPLQYLGKAEIAQQAERGAWVADVHELQHPTEYVHGRAGRIHEGPHELLGRLVERQYDREDSREDRRGPTQH